jgi:hypothetical protein
MPKSQSFPYPSTALRFKFMLDGSIRQDGPFECAVLGIGRCPFTHKPTPEFKYVRFGESCNDWNIYPVHDAYIGGIAVKPQQESAVTLRWDGREYAPERVAVKPARREVASDDGPSVRVG